MPDNITHRSECMPFIETNCLLEVRYDASQERSGLPIPGLSRILIRVPWCTALKAFLKSRKIASSCEPTLILSRIYVEKTQLLVTVDLTIRKPC